MIKQSLSYQVDNELNKSIIKIGYFPLRGRAQVPRLLLQYFKIQYQDVIFQSVKDWQIFKAKNQKDWPLLNLPFLIDKNIKLTQTVPICNYIINKYGNKQMLGKNIKDQGIINMYTLSIDNMGVSLVSLCWLQGDSQYIEEEKQRFWLQNLEQKMEALQIFIDKKQWMLGYLSIFDFSIYELIHYIDIVFPRRMNQFQKLIKIQKNIRDLPDIKKYQNSQRSIKVFLPPNPWKVKQAK